MKDISSAPAPDPIPVGAPISGGAQLISDGDYHIVSAVAGTTLDPGPLCLTIGGLPDLKNHNGANAELWSVLGHKDHVFTVTWLGNGFYKIKLKDSDNKCLDVPGGSLTRGTNVQQWQDNGLSCQQWRIDATNDGFGYTIRSSCNGWYLDVQNGTAKDQTNIRLWEGNGANAQKWYFVPWGGDASAKQELSDGEYEIIPQVSGDKALCVAGTNIELNTRRNGEEDIFQTTYLGNGYYKVINKDSGLSLDVADGKSVQGANLQLCGWSEGTNNAQQWLIKFCGDGYYNIVSKLNGAYVDLVNANPADGTNIQTCVGWKTGGVTAQKWRFIPWGKSVGQTIEDGEYQIVPQLDESKVLSVEGNKTESGTNLILNSHKNRKEHTFEITYLGDGYYSIINKYSNLALDNGGGPIDAYKNGANAWLWEQNHGKTQKWMIQPCGDGNYNIISNCTGLCLDVSDGNIVDGTNVWMWMTNQTDAQKWKFVPYKASVDAESVSLDKKTLTISVGEGSTLKATITPENASDRLLTWASSDPAIAEVDSQGAVTARAVGEAVISVTTKNGKTASCKVTVEKKQPDRPGDPDDGHVHSLVKVKATKADCKRPGNKEYWICEDCDKVYADAGATTETTIEERTIPKTTQHTWNEGTVTKDPTETREGERTFVCTVCGREKTEAIPATGGDDGGLLEVGDTLTDEDTGNSYIITSIKGNKRTAAFKRMGNRSRTVFTIPAKVTIDGLRYEITSIAGKAFAGNKKLKSISFGNNIETIGEKAFFGCIKLNRVQSGKNLKVIGNNAFTDCRELRSIIIPSKVKKIGKQAFLSCKKLKNITIETKYITKKAVGKQAFKGVYARATVKVPRGKVNTYRKILQLAGLNKKARVKS